MFREGRDVSVAPTHTFWKGKKLPSAVERVWGTSNEGKHVYKWYLVRKDSGNLYLDMEVATGSKGSEMAQPQVPPSKKSEVD